MFDAVLKRDGTPYHADDAFREFDDPHKQEWVCCPDENNRVTPRRGHYRHLANGERVWVVPHFVLLDDNRCVYGESEVHKRLKIAIATLLSNEELELSVERFKIPREELSFRDVERPHRWVEKSIDEKRPDVRAKFSRFHPFLGKGIAFEIEKTPRNRGERRDRSKYLAEKGWSVVWVDEMDIDSEEYTLKSSVLEVSDPYYERMVRTGIGDICEEITNRFFQETLPSLEEEMKKTAKRRVDEIIEEMFSLGKIGIEETLDAKFRNQIGRFEKKLSDRMESEMSYLLERESRRIVDRKIRSYIGRKIDLEELVSERVEDLVPSKRTVSKIARRMIEQGTVFPPEVRKAMMDRADLIMNQVEREIREKVGLNSEKT